MKIEFTGSFTRDEKNKIKKAVNRAQTLIVGMENIPTNRNQSLWFQSAIMKHFFRESFGKHNLTYLSIFRNMVMHLMDIDTVHVKKIHRRSSMSPEFGGADLGNVHAASDGTFIMLGERFFDSDEKTRALTIFHELTHIIPDGTEDYNLNAGLEERALIDFSHKHPKRAIKCAHMWEYFARKTEKELTHAASQVKEDTHASSPR